MIRPSRQHRQNRLLDLLTYAGLAVFSLVILLPVLWVVRTSFAPEVIAYEVPPRMFFPPTFAHYAELFSQNDFADYFKNSLVISILTTVLGIPLASWGGYAFARYRAGGRWLQFAVLTTQMLPGIVLVPPFWFLRCSPCLRRTT